MINVEVIADSIAPSEVRLTTVRLTYPRFAHSELMTHRVFSRNASSSRAIPVKRQIQMIIDDPVIPLAFTKNQKGMQGGEALEGEAHQAATEAWLNARDMAVIQARKLADLEVHKQYANRILEPWAHISVVVTSTDWDNFLTLRYHEGALPEMQVLAKKLYNALMSSVPKKLKNGEWHLPFLNDDEPLPMKAFESDENGICNLVRISTARCARTSYLTHDGVKPAVEADLNLHDRLVASVPLHASPAEHQAMAVGDPNVRSGNFRGWVQYRKTLKGENSTNFTPPEDLS